MHPTIRLVATLAAAFAPLACGGRAEAQYGGFGGLGWGFGFGYNQNAYSDVNYLNSRANTLASIAGAHTPQPLQAPQFQTRDDSIYDKYDLATRESMINRIAVDPDREMGTADPSGVLASARLERRQPRPQRPRRRRVRASRLQSTSPTSSTRTSSSSGPASRPSRAISARSKRPPTSPPWPSSTSTT